MTPLVFLPGAGGRASFWRRVADRLADLGPAHARALRSHLSAGGAPRARG